MDIFPNLGQKARSQVYEKRLQVIEKTLAELKAHTHETSGGADPRVDKITAWLEQNTSYYGS